MIFPLGTDRANRRPTIVTYALVAVCIVCYAVQVATGWGTGDGGPLADFMVRRAGPWYTYITSVFLHGDVLHLLMNMLFLWVFGPNVEDRLGRFGFLAFYLAGGIAASFAHVLSSTNPALGASGAISAVTGAFLVLFPLTRTRVLSLLFLGVFMIPSWWLIVFQIAANLFMLGSVTRTAVEAHLGGYAFGFVIAFILLATGVLKREPYDLFSIAKQRSRKRQFAEAARMREKADKVRAEQRDDPASDAVLEARAEVSRLVAEGDTEAATRAYLALVGEHGHSPTAATLSRGPLYAVANQLFQDADHVNAAATYERFLNAYPRDREAEGVRLILALINARYLNDPTRAQVLLGELPSTLDPDSARLAATLREELGLSPAGDS
ncbi:MAG: rhomboid family intramembrane serine protease [Planctomycetota bacterium]